MDIELPEASKQAIGLRFNPSVGSVWRLVWLSSPNVVRSFNSVNANLTLCVFASGLSLVLAPVALSADVQHVAVVKPLSRIAVAITLSPYGSPQSAKPLFEARMMLLLSYMAGTRPKNAVADSWS